jgi:signal transduction histidine kinase
MIEPPAAIPGSPESRSGPDQPTESDETGLPQRQAKDLAARGHAAIVMYPLLWALLQIFSDSFDQLPRLMLASGLLLVALGVVRFRLIRHFERQPGVDPRAWQLRFGICAVAAAAIWGGMAAAIVVQTGLHATSLLALLCTAGIAAGGVTSLAPSLTMVLCYLPPLLLPCALASAFSAGTQGVGIGLMTLTYLVFLSLVSRRMNKEYVESVRTQELLARHARELEHAHRAVTAALRAKDQFLSTMSHELRTPLNAILGFSELLADDLAAADHEVQRGYAQEIHTSGQRLLQLVNQMLEIVEIDSGRLHLAREPVDAVELATSALAAVRRSAEEKSIRLGQAGAAHSVMVDGDPRRLRQVLTILLDNAIKFTREGGEVGIDLLVTEAEQHIGLQVWDTGIGIAPADQNRIFAPFSQLDSGVTRRYQGAGASLALARRIAELHGGTLGVESEAGKGSRFTLRLPVR